MPRIATPFALLLMHPLNAACFALATARSATQPVASTIQSPDAHQQILRLTVTDSGFDPGLEDPGKAGVFFVAAGDLATLGAAARDAGLVPRHIDLAGCANRATLLLRIGVELDFPLASGRSWDALAKGLGDLQWLGGRGYVLLFSGAGEMHELDEKSFDALIGILDGASSHWAGRGVPFWSFMALRDKDFAQLEQ